MQEKMLFFPTKNVYDMPISENFNEITLTTKDNVKLDAWFLDNKSEKTVLFFHGNGGNLYYNSDILRIADELKLNALVFDYRSYGKSEGKIKKEEDLYTDGETAYNYLLGKGIKPNNIIFWGHSLGNAVSINLAKNKDLYAIIIESAFYSMDSMAKNQYPIVPTSLLLKYHFKNSEKIQNIKSPVLVIHGTNDEIIPYENGKKLFENAREPKIFLETTAYHNSGIQRNYKLYLDTFKKFLKL